MSKSTADAQLVFRAEQSAKVELESIAATLDSSSAKLLRRVLLKALPELRREAEEAVRKRDKLPHGITEDALDKAMQSLMRRFTAEEPIHLERHDLLSADSKAVWVLLSYIWGDQLTDGERKVAAALAESLAGERPVTKKVR